MLTSFRGLIGLATIATMLALGFILGFALISKLGLSKNPEAAAKGEQLLAKLRAIQIPLGLAGIGLGLLQLILAIF